MSKGNKHPAVVSGPSAPRGIVVGSKGGVAFTTAGLEMADHFFHATGFRMKQRGSDLHVVFGSQSAFSEDDEEYRLAIEIIFPVEMAKLFLYKVNWVDKSVGSDKPFAEVVAEQTQQALQRNSAPREYKIPKGNSFRSFAANFALMSLSTGQGAIEFFEAPPGTIVEAIFKNAGWRPNSDVRPILTIILSPLELTRFNLAIKEMFKDQTLPGKDKDV